MKRMKKWMFLFLSSAVFCSCVVGGEKPVGSDIPVFVQNLIVRYVEGPIEIVEYLGDPHVKILRERSESYSSPEAYPGGTGHEEFLRIAERNGDLSYNRSVNPITLMARECFAENFKEAHLVCTSSQDDAPWDADHPVGSRLDDVVQLEFSTYADYVRNGYPESGKSAGTENTTKLVKKFISELTPDDLAMIDCGNSGSMRLLFGNAPVSGTYVLDFTLVSADGKEKTARYTYDPENRK